MVRAPCCSKDAGLNRGAWTAVEDLILSEYITIHGDGGWRTLPQKAGLKRCGKSCRLRWLNYLRPDIKRGNISPDEEELIVKMQKLLGNRWSLIAGRLPGRTDNEIKNYWNTQLVKKLHNSGFSSRKTENINNTTSQSPSNCQEDRYSPETFPVRTTAVRIGKGPVKMQSDGTEIIEASRSWCETYVDEIMITNSDIDFTTMNNVEINGQIPPISTSNLIDQEFLHSPAQNVVSTSQSSFYLNDLSSPDRNLLSSPFNFSKDSLIEEFEGRAINESEEMCSLHTNTDQNENFTECNEKGIEELFNGMGQLDWIDELQYLRSSNLSQDGDSVENSS